MEQNAGHPAHRSSVRVDGRGVWYVVLCLFGFWAWGQGEVNGWA